MRVLVRVLWAGDAADAGADAGGGREHAVQVEVLRRRRVPDAELAALPRDGYSGRRRLLLHRALLSRRKVAHPPTPHRVRCSYSLRIAAHSTRHERNPRSISSLLTLHCSAGTRTSKPSARSSRTSSSSTDSRTSSSTSSSAFSSRHTEKLCTSSTRCALAFAFAFPV